MNDKSEWVPLLHSRKISKRQKTNVNLQFKNIPTVWKERFIKDRWQIIITNRMPTELGGMLALWYINSSEKKIWLNISIPMLNNNIIYKVFGYYIYMEYGNISQYDFFKRVCENDKEKIKKFMFFRGKVEYEAEDIFAEMFSYVIETDEKKHKSNETDLFWYVYKWVSGEIFNRNIKKIPEYIEVENDVIDEQIKCVFESYKNVPKKLRQTFIDDGWKIHISNRKIVETKNQIIDGLCSSLEKKIYVRSSSINFQSTIWHEFGHYMDYKERFYSEKKSFIKIFLKESKNIKPLYADEEKYNYAISSNAEYFAELVVNYMKNSEQLEKFVPDSYKIIAKILKKWI